MFFSLKFLRLFRFGNILFSREGFFFFNRFETAVSGQINGFFLLLRVERAGGKYLPNSDVAIYIIIRFSLLVALPVYPPTLAELIIGIRTYCTSIIFISSICRGCFIPGVKPLVRHVVSDKGFMDDDYHYLRPPHLYRLYRQQPCFHDLLTPSIMCITG